MKTTIKKMYYQYGIKKDEEKYISKRLECQQVKVECIHPSGFLKPIPILEWKWEVISTAFIAIFPKKSRQCDAIMVVVDNLSKATQFVAIKSTDKPSDIAHFFIKEIVRLRCVPKNIILDGDVKFTSKFWKMLFASFGTNLAFNTMCHPLMDGHIERVNSVLEDMLRMYVMHQLKRWEEFIPLVEFSYKNGYQE